MRGVLAAAVGMVAATAAAADAALERLVEQADAIVCAQIRSIDTGAMPADGPMIVEATVVKSLNGPLAENAQVRFDASAWMGPTYEPGERRILFLARSDAPGMAAWASVEVGWLDLFFLDEDLPACSLDTLAAFLESLGRQPPRPRLQFRASLADTHEHLLVPDNDRRCRRESDCVIIPNHCGGCACGVAIHQRWQAHYQEAFRFLCEGREGPVCDMHCPEQTPRCIDGKCRMGGAT